MTLEITILKKTLLFFHLVIGSETNSSGKENLPERLQGENNITQ